MQMFSILLHKHVCGRLIKAAPFLHNNFNQSWPLQLLGRSFLKVIPFSPKSSNSNFSAANTAGVPGLLYFISYISKFVSLALTQHRLVGPVRMRRHIC